MSSAAARGALSPLAAGLLAVLSACGSGGSAGEQWPAGTVLAVDGLPLSGAEVDQVTAWVAAVMPGVSAREHRRRALTGHLFPRLTAEAAFGAARDGALAEAKDLLAELRAEPTEPDPALALVGDWGTIGLEVWAALQDAPLGEWIGPIAGIGRLRLARCLDHAPGPHPGLDHFEIEVRDFPFVPPGTDRDALADLTWDTQLTIVDPEYERIVPLAWRANMQTDSDRASDDTATSSADAGAQQ
ncbi:hypothetical protein [Engelhardtia mirabilis]|uniref:Uncharacterized protein n=1 Tax=Engelhardtia mirabilis TaxID=2528011 RepID=A0A518BH36_9BACT|nr:hypothetical protein Pla133_13590 [Planctomycetes bacterium Pla133]QDV00618.1 hypothetical protein Pla86_13580 [Planctomycetes bacterium Pla86]